MKKIMMILLLLNYYSLITAQKMGFCATVANTYKPLLVEPVRTTNCPIYVVNIYIHYLFSEAAPGYDENLNPLILANLNDVYNNYGISFKIIGSRRWRNSKYTDLTRKKPEEGGTSIEGVLLIDKDTEALIQNDAINIYILDKNTIFSSGKAFNIPSKGLVIGGIRSVKFGCKYTDYIIEKSRAVAHEIGHCLGLQETHTSPEKNGDGDTLSDTPRNYASENGCTDPISCQFVGIQANNCNTCPVNSNPMTNQRYVMSYTVPPCMSIISPMQLDIIRKTLDGPLSSVVANKSIAPNLQAMTFDGTNNVNTFNYISGGVAHTINSNVPTSSLVGNINWGSNITSYFTGYGYAQGTQNTGYYFFLNPGYSATFTVSANNACGASTRNITFSAQSGYRLYSTTAKSTLSIQFSEVANIETLPQKIAIVDKTTNKIEKTIDVKLVHKNKGFKDKTLNIDVSDIKGGAKKVVLKYIKKKNDKEEITEYDDKEEDIDKIAPRSEEYAAFESDFEEARLYPTASNNSLTLDAISKTDKDGEIIIFDNFGALVNKMNVSFTKGLNTATIDISQLPSAFYTLMLFDKKTRPQTFRFTKTDN